MKSFITQLRSGKAYRKVITGIPCAALSVLLLSGCADQGKQEDKQAARKILSRPKTLPIKLDRPTYSLQYPEECKIDSTDADFDLDSYFTIDNASDNGFTSFFVFDMAIDAREMADAQLEAFKEKLIKNAVSEELDTWGNYKGIGYRVTGKLMGLMKGEVRIFAHSGDSTSFVTVCQFFDSDREKDEPGLRMIESSFRLK